MRIYKLLLNWLIPVFFSFTNSVFAQSNEEYWEKWNRNYQDIDAAYLLRMERNYADSVENNPSIPSYYSRIDKYKFKAEFLGKINKTDLHVIRSMKDVFKLFVGDAKQLDGMTENSVLFKIGDEEIWMPIQTHILKAFKKEIEKGDVVMLYCLFLNEHTVQNKLYNIFFISEFYL